MRRFYKKHNLLCWSAEFATNFKLHRTSIAHSTKKTRRNEGGEGNMRPRRSEATEREGERGKYLQHRGLVWLVLYVG